MHWTRKIRFDAYKKVSAAIRSGRIPEIVEGTKCVDCGDQAKCYEHRDYFKPLDVDPVCVRCNNLRGEAYPPVKGEPINSNGLPYRFGGKCWENLVDKKDKKESLAGADARNRTEWDDISIRNAQPLSSSRYHALQDYWGAMGKSNNLENGDLRARYFKEHDPYYICDDVV